MAKRSSLLSKVFWSLLIGLVAYLIYAYNPNILEYLFSTTTEETTTETTTTDDEGPTPPPQPADPASIRYMNYYPTLGNNENQLVKHNYFALSYANAYEQAEWVAYELTKTHLIGKAEERSGNFRPDPTVKLGSATPDDYQGSGYDRGHLAPAADMAFDKTAMSESFFMSNMSPQEPGFNRGIWKELEGHVRDFAYNCDHVYVVTGPILNKNILERIGKNNVAVPKSYYKVILDVTGTKHKGIAFVLPNIDSDQPIEKYVKTIDEVEKLTGLNFFPTMEKAQELALEGQSDIKQWNINQERAQMRIMEVQARLRSGRKLAPQ